MAFEAEWLVWARVVLQGLLPDFDEVLAVEAAVCLPGVVVVCGKEDNAASMKKQLWYQ